jgi:hypothetical protein
MNEKKQHFLNIFNVLFGLDLSLINFDEFARNSDVVFPEAKLLCKQLGQARFQMFHGSPVNICHAYFILI